MLSSAMPFLVRATAVLLLCASPALAQFSQQGPKLVGTGAEGLAKQGGSVSLSADGNTAIVGAPDDDGERGAARAWTRSGGVWTQQGPKLVGAGAVAGAVGHAVQGYSVSLSADGNTAIVGGYRDNNNEGAAWIWTRSAGVWSQQGPKLVGLGAVGSARQGTSVSISADGNTAIVGGWGDDNFAGAAWVWSRSGGVWTQQGLKLVGTGAVGTAAQGWAVALSGDGNTAIVGGHGDNSGRGAVWVWTRNAGVWTPQGSKLSGAPGGSSKQGFSVSISADGDTFIAGAYDAEGGNGAAWVWTRSAGVWTQQGNILVGSGGVGGAQQQGHSVSISGDGNTAIVGAPRDAGYAGAAWVWTRNAGVWTQQGSKLVGSGAVGGAGWAAHQGWSVALSGDGHTAMVGGPQDNFGAGAVWAWTRSGGIWSQQGSKLVGTGARGGATSQGFSVALSADGNTAIVGGNYGNSPLGAAWIWTRSAGVWTQQGSRLVGSGAVGDPRQGYSVSLSADGNTAIIGGYNDNGGAGAAWIWTRSAGVWTQQGAKLVGTGAVGRAQQGFSVSLSADGNTALVGGYEDNNQAGAAWVWTRSGGVWTQQGSKLVGLGANGTASQGISVSLSSDGNTALIGGSGDSNGGAAWVWTRTAGVWTQQGSKLVGTGAAGSAAQGYSVSLSADGNTALVGGNRDNASSGAAWVWTRSGGIWTQQGTKLVGSGAAGAASQGRSVSLSADGNMALVGGIVDNDGTGAAWVWTRSGGVWTQQGSKLVGSGAVGTSLQGSSVALASDANTAILGGYGDDGGIGAAWVFAAPPPTIGINDVTLGEGNAGNRAYNFTLTLSKASGSPVSVDYATAAGTSTAGTDYTSVSGTATFNPFVTTQPITVNVAGDAVFEPNETFFVNLTNPTNATIFDNQGLGTITDDDAVADISVIKTGPANAFRSAPVTYTITVSNAGPQTASNVVVTDAIPAGTSFVSATPSQGTCSGTATVTCNLGAIGVGANATIRLVLTAPATDGPISNTATAANTPESDPTPANNAGTSNAAVFYAGDIPTLSEWALIALAMALAAFAAVKIR